MVYAKKHANKVGITSLIFLLFCFLHAPGEIHTAVVSLTKDKGAGSGILIHILSVIERPKYDSFDPPPLHAINNSSRNPYTTLVWYLTHRALQLPLHSVTAL